MLEPAKDGAAPAGRLVGAKAVVRVHVVPAPGARLAVQRTDAEKGSPVEAREEAILETAKQNPADGYQMVTALVRRALGCAVNRKQELSDLQMVSRGPNWPSAGLSSAEPRLGQPRLPRSRAARDRFRAPGGPVYQSGRLEGGRPDVEERRSDRLARRGALHDTAYLRLGGGCQGCGMATVTLGQGIEVAITGAVPEIVRVVDVTDHAAGTNPYFEPAKK